MQCGIKDILKISRKRWNYFLLLKLLQFAAFIQLVLRDDDINSRKNYLYHPRFAAKHFREVVGKWDFLEAIPSYSSFVWLSEFNNALLHLLLLDNIQRTSKTSTQQSQNNKEPSANFPCC